MKTTKKVIALIVAIIMTMSLVVLPASAATVGDLSRKLTTEFPRFPVLRIDSPEKEYVRLLQRFLYVYPQTHETVYNTDDVYHGIDGGFGIVTDTALRTFQLNFFGANGVDGAAGPATWGAIYSCLRPSSTSAHYIYDGEASYNRWIMSYIFSGSSTCKLYTYNASDNRFMDPFRTITV